jgi:hypothetical protein
LAQGAAHGEYLLLKMRASLANQHMRAQGYFFAHIQVAVFPRYYQGGDFFAGTAKRIIQHGND